jgi:group I intron endonuclease
MAFIYKITNAINNKLYIGKSSYSSINKLKCRYKKDMQRKLSRPRLIIKAMIKYGIDSFVFECIHDNVLQHEINELEIYYIAAYDANNILHGYNLTIGGEGTVGYKWNDESRKKLSTARISGGYNGVNNPFYGHNHNIETINKIIESNKRRAGKKRAPTTQSCKDKISVALKGRIPWNKGVEYFQIKGDKNPNYRCIDMILFKDMVSNGMMVKDICGQLNISITLYYSRLKTLNNEASGIYSKDC